MREEISGTHIHTCIAMLARAESRTTTITTTDDETTAVDVTR
jgi:hypothetical protein